MTRPSNPAATAAVSTDDDYAFHMAAFFRSLRSRNRSALTIEAYKKALTQFYTFLTDAGHPRNVTAIRRDQVEAFVIHLQEKTERLDRGMLRAAGNGPDGKLSDATVAQRWRSLSVFFNWLHRDHEAIQVNPMSRMIPPRVGRRDVPIVPTDDVLNLLRTCSGRTLADRRDAAIIHLLFATGARISEIANLRVGDLRLDHEPPQALVHGKGDNDRLVTFSDEASIAIDRYMPLRRARRGNFDDRLWVGERGPLNSSGVSQMLRRRSAAAGISLHAHQLRHTFVSTWLLNGGSETDLIEQVGWADASAPVMLRRYGRAAAAARAHAHYGSHAPQLRPRGRPAGEGR